MTENVQFQALLDHLSELGYGPKSSVEITVQDANDTDEKLIEKIKQSLETLVKQLDLAHKRNIEVTFRLGLAPIAEGKPPAQQIIEFTVKKKLYEKLPAPQAA